MSATIVWSGNFIVARGVIDRIPPISLAFYRWLMASVIIIPIGLKSTLADRQAIMQSWKYLFWVALSGVALYNTFLYVAGHYSPAINLALIATTTSPVMAIILAAVFLKEKIPPLRLIGLLICICGIVLLLSRGSLDNLLGFHFTKGDWWLLTGAFCFAVYNTLVKIKPSGISGLSFLVIVFSLGTIMLFPFFIWEQSVSAPVIFDLNLIGIIIYLGLGACVISYLCWNAAIGILGSARTSLFGNLIPVFSTLEAVLILDEKITAVHAISGIIVITGLVLANLRTGKKTAVPSS